MGGRLGVSLEFSKSSADLRNLSLFYREVSKGDIIMLMSSGLLFFFLILVFNSVFVFVFRSLQKLRSRKSWSTST